MTEVKYNIGDGRKIAVKYDEYNITKITREGFEMLIEKRIPKEPRFYSGNYYCPDCGDLVGCHDIIMKRDNKFCKACGQKIDWGNENDRAD